MGDVNIGNTGGFKEHKYVQAGVLQSDNGDLLTDRITPVGSTPLFRVDFCPSVAGVLSVTFLNGATTTTVKLMGGSPLTVGVLYPFEFLVSRPNETVNFQYSKACTYRLVVREV